MQNFAFRPARLLRLRETTLKSEQARLAQEQAQAAALRAELEQLQESADRAGNAAKSQQWVNPADLAHMHHFHEGVRKQTVLLNKRIANQDEAVRKQQAAVMDANRAVKLLEKLREKKFSEWKQEAAREEDRLIDDFVSAKWNRDSNRV